MKPTPIPTLEARRDQILGQLATMEISAPAPRFPAPALRQLSSSSQARLATAPTGT